MCFGYQDPSSSYLVSISIDVYTAELGPNVECIIKIQREGAIDQYSICLDLTEKH